MNELTIKLSGEIQNSNFEEWKKDLIAQIQSTNTELKTDDDFSAATGHIKLFKSAEKSLKDAKQSAIEQAADIQRLFSAIDEVSEEARQARLSLERQVKARKLEIKEEIIDLGLERVRDFIEHQNPDFKQVDSSHYVDRMLFEDAVKGKAGIKGMEAAINALCESSRQGIAEKSAEIDSNAEILAGLSAEYQLLFQDRNALLALNCQELSLTVDKRIALYREENARLEVQKTRNELKALEDVELNPDAVAVGNESVDKAAVHSVEQEYRLLVDIVSSKEAAIEIARVVKQTLASNTSVSAIRLTRKHE